MRTTTKLGLAFWTALFVLALFAFDHAMRIDARNLCNAGDTVDEDVCREAGN